MSLISGIILVVIGVVFPIGTLFWLNGRMDKQPRLVSRQVGLILALNGIVPVALITLGVGLLMGKLWTSLEFKVVLMVSSLAAIGVIAALWGTTRRVGRTGNRNGG